MTSHYLCKLQASSLGPSEGREGGATIRPDNQAVIAALAILKPKPAQSIVDEVLLQAEVVCKRAEHPEYRLEVSWVRGTAVFSAIWVDVAAKEAVQEGGVSFPPLSSGSSLTFSVSAVRQAFATGLRARWKSLWGSSPILLSCPGWTSCWNQRVFAKSWTV